MAVTVPVRVVVVAVRVGRLDTRRRLVRMDVIVMMIVNLAGMALVKGNIEEILKK